MKSYLALWTIIFIVNVTYAIERRYARAPLQFPTQCIIRTSFHSFLSQSSLGDYVDPNDRIWFPYPAQCSRPSKTGRWITRKQKQDWENGDLGDVPTPNTCDGRCTQCWCWFIPYKVEPTAEITGEKVFFMFELDEREADEEFQYRDYISRRQPGQWVSQKVNQLWSSYEKLGLRCFNESRERNSECHWMEARTYRAAIRRKNTINRISQKKMIQDFAGVFVKVLNPEVPT